MPCGDCGKSETAMEQVSRGFVYVWVARAARLQRRGFVPMVA